MRITNIGRASNLVRATDGEWRGQGSSAKLTIYQQKLVEYLNFLDPIFRDVQMKDEFGFLWILLNIRRLSPVKWKSFEVLKDIEIIFEAVNKTLGTWKGANAHTGLFRYGLVVESDEVYGFILNLLRCLNDEPPLITPFFPTITNDIKGKEIKITLKPKDKIAQIKSLAKQSKIDFYLFDEFYDNKLRNAIFHSAYHFDPYDGSLTIIGDAVVRRDGKAQKVDDPDIIYTHEQLLGITNKSFAFFSALMILRETYMKSYEGGIEIVGTHEFIPHKFTTVAKEGIGLIGLMETAGPEPFEIPFGKKMRVGTYNQDDVEALSRNEFSLSLSLNEKAQARIDSFPRILQKYVAQIYKSRLGIK